MDEDDDGAGRTTLDRRSFVKGAVVGAAVGAAGAAGVALWRLADDDAPPASGTVTYAGAKVLLGSPTNRGVPIVPIRVDDEGFVRVVAEDLTPFVYCGRRADAEETPATADLYARYHISRHRLETVEAAEARERWWYYDRLGEPIHIDDFAARDHGDGASFVWRDPAAVNPFLGVLIKLRPESIEADGPEAAGSLAAAMPTGEPLVAFDSACTHFCCVAGWHEDRTAELLGFWNTIFCTCHMARFDPTRIEMYTFEPPA